MKKIFLLIPVIALFSASFVLAQDVVSDPIIDPEPVVSLSDQVSALPESIRAGFKADVIASEFPEKVLYTGYLGDDVVIDNVSAQSDHLEFYLRSWSPDDTQYGFGKDGTIETERVRVFNPPFLVPDGTTHQECNQFQDCYDVNNYVEDPAAALQIVAAEVVRLVGKTGTVIEKGTFGHTTDIYYPTNDGHMYKNDSTSWATTHDAASASQTLNDQTSDSYPLVGMDGSNFIIGRFGMLFDLTSLGSDTVSSATFDIKGAGTKYDDDNDGNDYLVMTSFNSSSTTTWVNADFDNFGNTAYSNTLDITSISTSAFNTFTLNGTGISALTPGNVYLGLREGHDLLNDPFVGAANKFNGQVFYFVSQTGTTDDPKLTIVHTGAATSTPATASWLVIHSSDSSQPLIYAMIILIAGATIWISRKKTS